MDRRQPPLGSVGRRIGRAALRVTAIGGLLCAFFVVGATDSRAEISNDGLTCHATIAGVSIDSQDSENAGSAIEVSKDATVTVHEDASSMIQTYTVDLAFALRGWQVASGGSTTSSWDSSVKVKDYSRFGVGLYRVTATSHGVGGSSCTANGLIRVVGNPVPDTIGGDAAAGAALISLLGLAGSGAKAGSGGSTGDVQDNTSPVDGGPGSAPEEIPTGVLPPDDDWCFPGFVLPAMLTVFASMGALGVPGAAAAAPRPKYRRSHWRPYISGFSIFFGILGASAGLILMQQYAILFPSLRVVIIGEALGLVAAIVFPSLMRIRRVRRYNRRLANRERREALVARAASPAPPPPPPPSPS